MYAIVDIAGQQYKVEKDQKVFVNRLEGKEGSKVSFDKVYLVDNDGKVQVGTPVVKNTIVSASIISHMKGDTVKVFHKKRRKGYQKLNGHRQSLTEILIEGIGEGKAVPAAKKAEPKAEKTGAKATPADKKSEAKAAPKKVTETAKPTEKAKTAAKKPVAKKTTEKKVTAAAKPAAKKAAPKKAAPKKVDEKKSEE